MKTILITGIGSDIAQSIAIIIRERFPEWKIIGCDVNIRHGGNLFSDKFIVSPQASTDQYLAWLEDLLKKEGVSFCIPVSEAELEFFFVNQIFEIGKAKIIMANPQSLKIGLDKFQTNQYLNSIGVDVPWTILSDNLDSIPSFPCIFKHRKGAGSKVLFECKNRDEAVFYSSKYSNGIFQELLLPSNQEVTCAVYRNKKGKINILQLLRELDGGFTGWAKVIQDQEVSKQCELLAKALDLNGSINVQLRITEFGPRIFEINPRFSSTVLMRHMMGFEDVIWSIEELLEINSNFHSPKIDTVAVRVQGVNIIN
jgi:carbamoyl-phosphate synthase large subunit